MPRSTGLPLVLTLAFALGACAQAGPEGAMAPGDAATAGAAPAGARGACGAEARQALVGQSVSVLDASELPADTRMLFPGMSATTDFRPDRLNVSIGASDRIDRVFCG